MKEVHQVLRPVGYWILSGPPINWRNHYQEWRRPKEELEKEQNQIEEIAKLLCWEKKYEKSDIAIWRKRINNESCCDRDPYVTVSVLKCRERLAFGVMKMEGLICSTLNGAGSLQIATCPGTKNISCKLSKRAFPS